MCVFSLLEIKKKGIETYYYFTMDIFNDSGSTPETHQELTSAEKADVAIRTIIFVVGIIGNILVIFFILFLNEFRKISHWYVLQLALADFLFLLTLPFRISELLHRGWIYGAGFCKARQTILFFNYYASILFLMIMALDRYFAVCHALSSRVQRLRTRGFSYIITAMTWLVALLLCIPVMMYGDTVGTKPECFCSLNFPKDIMHWCRLNMPENITSCYETRYEELHTDSCSGSSQDSVGGGGVEEEEGSFNVFESSGYEDILYELGLNGTDGLYPDDGTYNMSGGADDSVVEHGCYVNSEMTGWIIFTYFNFIVMFVIPLLVIAISYTLIVVRLMSTNVSDRQNSVVSQTDRQSNKGNSRRRIWRPSRRRSSNASTGNAQREKSRVAMVCALLVLLFVICWLPFHSVHMAKIPGISGSSLFCAALTSATSILAYLNSALNPYLYNFLGTFQKRLRQIRDHKRTRSILSATGLTRIVGRSSSVVHSSESSKDKGKRASVPSGSRSGSVTNEKIALRTIERGETTSSQ